MCERETVVGKGSGSRSCVCVSVRERGDGSRGCLIGKQMNNVSLGWRQKETATNVVSTGERERE